MYSKRKDSKTSRNLTPFPDDLFSVQILSLSISSFGTSGRIRKSRLYFHAERAPGVVLIMTFTALTGAVSHFAIGGMPNMFCLALCVLFTLLWARIAALFANKASPKTLNRAVGVVLTVLGASIIAVRYLA